MKIKALLALLVSIVVLAIASHELIRAASSIPEGYVNIYGGGYVDPPCNPSTDPQKCNQYHLQGNNCSPSGKYCEAKSADWGAMFLCNGNLKNCDTGMIDKGQNKKFYIGNRHCGQTIQIDVFDHNCEDGGGWSCATPKDYLVYYTGDCAPPSPKPTTPPACNTDCSQDVSICNQASGGCTYCNPTSKKCETPPVSSPSPTASTPACGTGCSADPTICNQAGGGCNYCNPNAGYTCTTPPSSSPPPGGSPQPSSPPAQSPSPSPSQPATSPTPSFDENWCSCNNVNVGQIIAGMPVVVTAKGKVDPPHVNEAKIRDFTFRVFEGTKPPVAETKPPIPATKVSAGSATAPAEYQAQWTWDVPTTLQRGVDYRIQAQIKCVSTSTAIQYPYTSVVLAASTENQGFLSVIVNFFRNLFGGKSTQTQQTQDTSKTFVTTQDMTTQEDDKDSLQLKTFTPARVTDKTCSFVKFRFD